MALEKLTEISRTNGKQWAVAGNTRRSDSAPTSDWSHGVSQCAHNPKVVSSSATPATNYKSRSRPVPQGPAFLLRGAGTAVGQHSGNIRPGELSSGGTGTPAIGPNRLWRLVDFAGPTGAAFSSDE